jgi:hypothetical protein
LNIVTNFIITTHVHAVSHVWRNYFNRTELVQGVFIEVPNINFNINKENTITYTFSCTSTYWWCCQARGPMLQQVKNEKARAGIHHVAIANPAHSNISPKKFAPETKLNIPPAIKDNTLHSFFLFCFVFQCLTI